MAKPVVSLFVTCLVDQLFPRVGLAMADVLERLGYRVHFPEAQTCCGQPAFNTGYRDEARTVARHFLSAFRGEGPIVCPSGSCTAMVTHHYSELFEAGTAERRESDAIAARVVEFSRFLTDVAQVDDLGARFPGVATYHDSCHSLRELGIKHGPRRLLAKVRDLELREMSIPEECCGFGGTFSVKFADISGAMVRTKIEAIHQTGAGFVIANDASCLMQIQGALLRAGSTVKTAHLAEVLAAR